MGQTDNPPNDNEALRERLSRLVDACLRINESLDLENVLQEVVDNALALTGAQYGVITVLNDTGTPEDLVITAGLTAEEHDRLKMTPERMRLYEYLSGRSTPLRVPDFYSHAASLCLPQSMPVPVGSFMAAPVRHQGKDVGNIFLGKRDDRGPFSREDEEILVMFSTQAALVIANARRYRDEQQARADLEALINTSPVGVVVFDARTGGLLSVNREAQRIVDDLRTPNQPIEHLLEVSTVRRADGRVLSLADNDFASLLSIGETVRAEEFVIQVPGGRSITTLANSTPIRADDGEVATVVVTLQDITPVEDLERLRTEFLGMVSHELRTPLTAIKGSAATLLEAASSLDPAEVKQFYRIINEQADYMRDMISDLIDVVRIDTGTLSVNLEPRDVSRLIDEARNTFLNSGGRNNIRINLAPDIPRVMADRRRVVQVLNNLLSNASRNSHETSTVRLSAAPEDKHVAVSVSDDGRGVPADRLPHLFRKFSHIGNQERGRDLGLGLAICKGIVEAHGGHIWAESEGPGLGSRFTFTLPIADESMVVKTESRIRASKRFGRPLRKHAMRVLAVDDDPRTLRLVRDALSNAGCEPVVTGDPTEVLDLMEAADPHVVMLDFMLPGTDGIELMRNILAAHDVPVVFLSAYDQDEVVTKAFEMGAVDYIVKPFSPTELAARIKAASRKHVVQAKTFALGHLAIDYAARTVTVAGRQVELTALEFQLLAELSVNAGAVLTHDQLLRRIWGTRKSADARSLRTVVKVLRRKLGDNATNPTYIFTVPRVGYRMAKPEQ